LKKGKDELTGTPLTEDGNDVLPACIRNVNSRDAVSAAVLSEHVRETPEC
jgi:hypothetical protein